MAVQTNDKKLDGKGLGVVWGCVQSLYNLLAGVVETNRIKHLGGVESLSLNGTFAKNSLITCANVVYLSNAKVTGLPNNIVTEDGVMVTDNGEVVVDGANTESKWAYICGQHENVSPAMETELSEKVNVRDMAQYINGGGYNPKTQNIELTHDGKVVCQLGFGDVIGDAIQPLLDRLDLIESRYVYEE